MALKFNPFMTGASGLPAAMNSQVFVSFNRLYVYPDTIAYPSSCPSTATAGHILTYINPSFTQTGGTLNLVGSLAATANATGNIGWWHLTNSANPSLIGLCGNSVTTAGNGGVVILSTLSPTANASVTLTSLSITIS